MPSSKSTRDIRRIEIAVQYAIALSELMDEATTDTELAWYRQDVADAIEEVKSVILRAETTEKPRGYEP